MFESGESIYAPLLLSADEDAVDECSGLDAAIIPATVAMNPRMERFRQRARDKSRTLIVDPRSAMFQFEGYMSMEDVRSLPYSPGLSTLGALWTPEQFTREFRAATARQVLQVQQHLGADVAIAPYFFVATPDHAWLEVAVEFGREMRVLAGRLPVAVAVCVDIDAILPSLARERFADAFSNVDADLFMLTVINFDELEATPEEARAVLDLLNRLAQFAPVMPQYVGRFGLTAIAHGAIGYAGGALELDSHPQRYLREGLNNLHSDAHYLDVAMMRLPVRLAAAVTEVVPEADTVGRPPTWLVRRRRIRHALNAKTSEARWLGALAPAERRGTLETRFAGALSHCVAAADALADATEELGRGRYHYLEVLRELLGGPEAELLGGAGF